MLILRNTKLLLDPTRYDKVRYRLTYFKYPYIKGVSYLGTYKDKRYPNLILYITDHPEYGYFELYQISPSIYSCHSRTETKDGFGHEKGYSKTPIPQEDKERLFRALIENLPSNSIIQPPDYLSPGGKHAFETLGDRGNGLLEKIGDMKWKKI